MFSDSGTLFRLEGRGLELLDLLDEGRLGRSVFLVGVWASC